MKVMHFGYIKQILYGFKEKDYFISYTIICEDAWNK
jgi:hypothetical protein